MKNICSLCILIPVFFFGSCASKPETPVEIPVTTQTETTPAITEPVPVTSQDPTPVVNEPVTETPQTDEVIAQFDTVTITKKTFENTKTEMQVVVDKLNKITLDRDYKSWLEWLSEEYYRTYSDPVTLETVSASLPIKNIKLRTIKDYFNYVFVPSRQNMRVDDIQFISPTRVYVIMEITPKSPAAIYILEKTDEGWKLVPKNQ
jgi:hypothetical protein